MGGAPHGDAMARSAGLFHARTYGAGLRGNADALCVGMSAEPLSFAVEGADRVSGLLLAPQGARACYVFAHGAGAGMKHPFMAAVAGGLAERGIATLRYQFPYMERGSKRPDAPVIAQA